MSQIQNLVVEYQKAFTTIKQRNDVTQRMQEISLLGDSEKHHQIVTERLQSELNNIVMELNALGVNVDGAPLYDAAATHEEWSSF